MPWLASFAFTHAYKLFKWVNSDSETLAPSYSTPLPSSASRSRFLPSRMRLGLTRGCCCGLPAAATGAATLPFHWHPAHSRRARSAALPWPSSPPPPGTLRTLAPACRSPRSAAIPGTGPMAARTAGTGPPRAPCARLRALPAGRGAPRPPPASPPAALLGGCQTQTAFQPRRSPPAAQPPPPPCTAVCRPLAGTRARWGGARAPGWRSARSAPPPCST